MALPLIQYIRSAPMTNLIYHMKCPLYTQLSTTLPVAIPRISYTLLHMELATARMKMKPSVKGRYKMRGVKANMTMGEVAEYIEKNFKGTIPKKSGRTQVLSRNN